MKSLNEKSIQIVGIAMTIGLLIGLSLFAWAHIVDWRPCKEMCDQNYLGYFSGGRYDCICKTLDRPITDWCTGCKINMPSDRWGLLTAPEYITNGTQYWIEADMTPEPNSTLKNDTRVLMALLEIAESQCEDSNLRSYEALELANDCQDPKYVFYVKHIYRPDNYLFTVEIYNSSNLDCRWEYQEECWYLSNYMRMDGIREGWNTLPINDSLYKGIQLLRFSVFPFNNGLDKPKDCDEWHSVFWHSSDMGNKTGPRVVCNEN